MLLGKETFLNKLLKSENFLIVISILILLICISGISSIYGFSAYPDEFGYWSAAANFWELDWSKVASIGSYYSYGYSFILFVILGILKDGILAYRAAIVVNSLMQIAAVWIIYRFICEFRDIKGDYKASLRAAIISSISVLYPAWTLYSQCTMSESLIFFLFVFVSYLLYKFIHKPSVIKGICLCALAIYMYLVHMRMIGTVIAIVLTFVIWALCSGNRKTRVGIISIIIALVVIFLISFVIKSRIVSSVYTYTSNETLNWNDYNGQLSKISKIFSLKGLQYLLENICGKVLYLSLSTYGIGIWGLSVMASLFIKSIKSLFKNGSSAKDLFQIYAFLAVIFQIGIALIYLIDSPSPNNSRLDLLLHGRYTDMLVPALFIYGIYSMIKSSRLFMVTGVVSIADIILAVPIYLVINRNYSQMDELQGFTMAGVSYMISPSDTDSKAFLIRALILGIVLTWFVCIVVWASYKTKAPLMIAGICILQLSLSVFTCNKYLYSIQPSVYTDILLSREIHKLENRDPERQIIHIYEDGVQYIEIVQFNLRERNIDVINAVNNKCDISILPINAIIVTEADTIYKEELENAYDHSTSYGHMNLYYNE